MGGVSAVQSVATVNRLLVSNTYVQVGCAQMACRAGVSVGLSDSTIISFSEKLLVSDSFLSDAFRGRYCRSTDPAIVRYRTAARDQNHIQIRVSSLRYEIAVAQAVPPDGLRFFLLPLFDNVDTSATCVLRDSTLGSMDSAVLVCPRTTQIVQLDFRTDPRWEHFVSMHPDALIYHHWGWLAALEAEYDQPCLSLASVDESGELDGILPLFYTKGLSARIPGFATGRRLSSLPRTPMAGPLATSAATAAALVQHAAEVARTKGVQLEIKTPISDLHSSVGTLTCTPWRPTYVVELPPVTEGAEWVEFWENLRLPRACVSCEGCRRLRFGNAKRQHRVNWSVNKAIKLGLRVREAESEEDLKHWYRLYLLTMRNNSVPPRPYRFFASLWFGLRPSGGMRLLMAEKQTQGKISMVAGSILLQFGQTVFYAFTGCDPANFQLHPHDILQIEAIRGACRAGFRWYDFGEVAEEHEALAQFKTKWGGSPKPLYRYYSGEHGTQPGDGTGGLALTARRIWKRLPTRATVVLGDLIYSRL